MNKQNTNAGKKRLFRVLAVTSMGLVCAGPVMAQVGTNGAQNSETTMSSGTSNGSGIGNDSRDDRSPNYSWIGLLGLAGLTGLLRKQPTVVRRDAEYKPANG